MEISSTEQYLEVIVTALKHQWRWEKRYSVNECLQKLKTEIEK